MDVAFLSEVEEAPGAHSEHLWDESVYVAIPEKRDLAKDVGSSWAELCTEIFVVRAYASGSVMSAWIMHRLNPHDIPPNIHQHDVSRECLLGMVSAGYGITVVAESATALAVPGVIYRPILEENATMSVRMAWLDENENPALGRFLSHARRIARRSGAR